jgi:hypothetical protein
MANTSENVVLLTEEVRRDVEIEKVGCLTSLRYWLAKAQLLPHSAKLLRASNLGVHSTLDIRLYQTSIIKS